MNTVKRTLFIFRRDLRLEDNTGLIHAPEEVLKADGKTYTVFTPFYRASLQAEEAPNSVAVSKKIEFNEQSPRIVELNEDLKEEAHLV